MRADEFTGYRDLHDAVARVLPAAADGSRRPAERNALRAYWEVGRLLNEHLSGGATYGQRAIARLAADLNLLPRTLYRARKVHERLPTDVPALTNLTWSHCRLLVTVDDDEARRRLMARAVAAGWSVRRLQEHLNAPPAAMPAAPMLRVGTYRIVAVADTSGVEAPAFDLGFGIRRPLALPGKTGKRTKRLLWELVPGDVVEHTTDDKGRPALRRVWGRVASRLYVHTATRLRPVATATVQVQLELGFDVIHECRLRLRPPAHRLSRAALEAAVASTPLPVLVRSLRLPRGQGYAGDLYRLSDHTNPEATPQHLNAEWVPADACT